jgi:hypothetical protein
MSTQGMTITAIARTLRAHASTVSRWLVKAGAHVKRFSEEQLVVSAPAEVQLDELRVGGIQAAAGTWAWSAIEVTSRAWLAPSAQDAMRLHSGHLPPSRLTAQERQILRAVGLRGEV